jgi:hypothetical protein
MSEFVRSEGRPGECDSCEVEGQRTKIVSETTGAELCTDCLWVTLRPNLTRLVPLMSAIRGKPEEYHHNSNWDELMYNFMKVYPLDYPLPPGLVLNTTVFNLNLNFNVKVNTYSDAVTYDYAEQRVIVQRQADGCYPVVTFEHGSNIVLTWDITDPQRDPDEISYACISHNRGHIADLKWTTGGPEGFRPRQIGYRNYSKRHHAWFFQFNDEQPVWCCDS